MGLIDDADNLIKVLSLIGMAYMLYQRLHATSELHDPDWWLAEKSATANNP